MIILNNQSKSVEGILEKNGIEFQKTEKENKLKLSYYSKINDIIRLGEKFFKVNRDIIFFKTRREDICKTRQIIMVVIRDTHKLIPLEVIGHYCGKKDHATVLHAIKTINNLSATGDYWGERYNDFAKYVNMNLRNKFTSLKSLKDMSQDELFLLKTIRDVEQMESVTDVVNYLENILLSIDKSYE